MGVKILDVKKAYPFSRLAKADKPLKDVIAGKTLFIKYEEESNSAVIEDEQGKTVASTTLYWFAWSAFNPDTLIYGED